MCQTRCIFFVFPVIPGLLRPCSHVIVQQGSMDPGSLLCITSHLRLQPSISQQGHYRILMWLHLCLADHRLAAAKLPDVLQGACRTCTTALLSIPWTQLYYQMHYYVLKKSLFFLGINNLFIHVISVPKKSQWMICTSLRQYKGT